MKASLLMSTSVLQLNAVWQPLRYRTVEYALVKLFNLRKEEPLLPVHIELTPEGNLDSGTRPMSIEEWIELPPDEAHPFFKMTRNRTMKVPLVIITPSYHRIPTGKLQLNKRGLYIRDKGHCGYCNKRIALDEATIDHIIPRHQDGETTWMNTALACGHCNNKKGNRTPKQAGMPLLIKPHLPKTRPLLAGRMENPCPEHLPLLK